MAESATILCRAPGGERSCRSIDASSAGEQRRCRVLFGPTDHNRPGDLVVPGLMGAVEGDPEEPQPAIASDRKQPSARTMAVSQLSSRRSRRTTSRSKMIPPASTTSRNNAAMRIQKLLRPRPLQDARHVRRCPGPATGFAGGSRSARLCASRWVHVPGRSSLRCRRFCPGHRDWKLSRTVPSVRAGSPCTPA